VQKEKTKPYTITTNDGNTRHYMDFEKAHSMQELLQVIYPELKPKLTIKEVINE
jgi:hypothetical protein